MEVRKIATVAELLVKIGADSQGLRKELAASQRQIKRAFSPEQMAISDSVITGTSAFTVALGAVGVASVKMAGTMEQNKVAFEKMLGSAAAAEAFLQQLATFAEKTPFDFPGLVASSKKLLAFGFQAQEIIPMMTSIGDAVSGVGGNVETLDRVTLAFGQMKTKGMVSAEEMNQLAEAGIPAWEMLAKTIGTDIPTAMDLAEKKSINADAAIAGMISQMGEKYSGMMDQQSKKVPGILANMQDKVGSIMRDMGEDITEALDLEKKLSQQLEFLDGFADKVKSSGIRQALIEMVPDSILIPAIGTISVALTATLLPAIGRVALAAKGMWLAIGGPLGLAVAIGATAIGTLAVQSKRANAESDLMNKIIHDGNSRLLNYSDSANKASESLGRLNSSGIEGGLSKVGEEIPWFDDWQAAAEKAKKKTTSTIITPDKKEAAQVLKANAEYALEVEKQNARNMVDLAQKEAEALERQRGDGMQAIREYWRSRQKEDSAGLDGIKKYWDKRTAIETSGIDQEIKALNSEVSILNDQISNTSDASQQIDLKKKLLQVTTDLTLKERERSEVLKKNSTLANEDTVNYIEKYASLLESTKKSMKDLAQTNVSFGLKGSEKGFAEIENEKTARLQSVKDVVDNWDKGAAEIKKIYGITIEDSVNKDQWRAQQENLINKQALDKRKDYLLEGKAFEDDINQARNTGDIAAFAAQLSTEQALLAQDLTGRQAMIDVYYQAWQESHRTTIERNAEILGNSKSAFQDFFSSLLTGTATIGEAFNSLLVSIWGNIVDSITKEWAAKITTSIASSLSDIGLKGQAEAAAIKARYATQTTAATAYYSAKATAAAAADTAMATSATTALATVTTASTVAAAALATAWAPAAAMVSLATMGANSAPAMAGITATTTMSAGLAGAAAGLPGLATGGPVRGPGTGTSDSVLMWGSHGEYMIQASAVRELGLGTMHMINQGILPGYATGGLVTGPSLSSVGGRYKNAVALPKTITEKETAGNSQEQRPADQYHIRINAADARSFRQMLENGGGAEIARYAKRQVRSFAPVGV